MGKKRTKNDARSLEFSALVFVHSDTREDRWIAIACSNPYELRIHAGRLAKFITPNLPEFKRTRMFKINSNWFVESFAQFLNFFLFFKPKSL